MIRHRIRSASLARFSILFLLAFCVSCSGKTPHPDDAPRAATDAATVVATGAKRADPGYIQYLERLSMLGSQTELARVVSGSQLAWIKPSGTPFPEPLLALADTWLHVNPLTMLPETKRSVFASLAGPQYWQIFGKARIGGVYVAPTSGSGSLWAYNRRASASGEDVIQYTFSESAGTDNDYFRLLAAANANKKLLGMELTPAATGLGPDFFLAARYHRQYAGIYCMVELPQKVWGSLPPVGDQWQGAPLTEEQTAFLAAMNLLPPAMSQDFFPTGKKDGWAVTGEIHGVDGLVRRWVYRYHDTPDQPVLNWEDPSAGARRILSGSTIRSVGLLGGALIGFRLEGLYGLDAAAGGVNPYPGREAALTISREVRRYGGWSWLRDDIPLSLAASLTDAGPEFFRDTIFSPGVEHAVLTGSTALLKAMVDDALMLGLDMRRFVHATTAESGVDYALPHLAEVASGNRSASALSPAAAKSLRAKTIQEVQNTVYGASLASPKGEDKPPLSGRHLSTTSAGVAALALGMGNAASVTKEILPRVREGHFLQIFVKSMLPGIFMLSGQDMAGSLPLSWHAMTDNAAGWDVALASRGAYALTQTVFDTAITLQGVPRAKSIYESADVQILHGNSFAGRLSALMGVRSTYNVANARLHGRFETAAPGCFAYVLVPPSAGTPPLPAEGGIPRETPARKEKLTVGEAFLLPAGEGRKLSLTERSKAEHAKNERIRKKLEQQIITVPNLSKTNLPGDTALIVVVNFSGGEIREVFNLYHDPLLQRIRQKGEPVLLPLPEAEGGAPGISMSSGPQTVTVILPPWRAAVVRIGSH